SIARCRCLSKLWGYMFQRFTDLFQTRPRPSLLFVLQRHGEWSFFSSPQLQNPYKKSSLVVSADFHVKFSRDMCPVAFHMKFLEDMWPSDFRGLTFGLIYLSSMRITEKNGEDDAVVHVIFNPRTRQFASLPKLETDGLSRSFLGFDPIDKQFKILSVDVDDHRILTLGTEEMSCRKIQCPLWHRSWPEEGICINGVLYYLAETYDTSDEPYDGYVIVCFDVRSEKYKFIELEYFEAKSINYMGKLGRINWMYTSVGSGRRTLELHMWVLEDIEKQEWSKFVYTFPANELVDLCYVSVAGVTATGEIVLSMKYTSKPLYVFYISPERNTLQRVEIQGFGEYYDDNNHRVSVFVDYM
ncbi:hypothetical protein EUTSA_v10009316mg, partial [Eutrema salsugineum]